MTYCLGISLPTGLVMAADSRSNAGVDQVARVHKLKTMQVPGERVLVILSAGNLGTTQAVVTTLEEAAGRGGKVDLYATRSLFETAETVGAVLRKVMARDGAFVKPYGDPSASFIVGGQIRGEAPRLFQVYSAGNVIEASDRAPFLQIGETKYGKPILDRALEPDTPIDEAAKLALLSFDGTIRSNLSVGPPIDLLRYQVDSFSVANLLTIDEDDPYWRQLREDYSRGLNALVDSLPPPPNADSRTDHHD